MKRIIAVLLVLMVSVAALAACGGSGGSGLTGKYNLVSLTEDGHTVTAEQFAEMGLRADEFYLEFVDSSKFNMVVFGDKNEGTYKLDNKAITLTVDGEPAQATIDGNKITLDADGSVMVFEKK